MSSICVKMQAPKGRKYIKNADPLQVREFVSGYSKAPPSTVGSVLVQDIIDGGQYSAVDSATVHFNPIPDDIIEQLIQERTVFSCAGAAHTVSYSLSQMTSNQIT